MENASKALIIAGAILLAIAIIGIGMYVYNMAQSTIQGANMTQTEITAYNSEFVKYQGSQRGTVVNALRDAVMAHNVANQSDTTKQISLDGKTTASDIAALSYNAGTLYTVTLSYNNAGLINAITTGTAGG